MSIKQHDEWLIAFTIDREREYLIHTEYPCFFARLIECDESGDPIEEAHLSGLTISLPRGALLCEIKWIDQIPDTGALEELAKNAQAALDNFDESSN